MIILLLGSLLCHMPDLSVGRGMHLALLTINQPDWEGCWLWLWSWDEKVLAAAGCRPYHTHSPTDTYTQVPHVWKQLVQQYPFCLLSSVLPLLCLTSCPLSFLLLICSQFLSSSNGNFQHSSPFCPHTLSIASSMEDSGELIQSGQKYENIRGSYCVYQSASSGESRWKHWSQIDLPVKSTWVVTEPQTGQPKKRTEKRKHENDVERLNSIKKSK